MKININVFGKYYKQHCPLTEKSVIVDNVCKPDEASQNKRNIPVCRRAYRYEELKVFHRCGKVP